MELITIRIEQCRFCNQFFDTYIDCWEHEQEEHPIEYDLSLKNYQLEQRKGWPTFIGNIMKLVIFIAYSVLTGFLADIIRPWFLLCLIPVVIFGITFWINIILENKIYNNKQIIRTQERKEQEKRLRELRRQNEK